MSAVKLRWSAWFEERTVTLPLPPGWQVDVCDINDRERGPSLGEALSHPIGIPPLSEMARGAHSAAIAVEDITRPADAAPALEALLDLLAAAGIPSERVTVVIALGGHAPMRLDELRLKVGEAVLQRCDVINHHPYEGLVDLGVSKSGIPIKINQRYYEADIKLAVGCVLPHPYAGFGGGGKIVLPGIAGIETLEMNHRPAVTGLSGAGLGVVEGNRARAEMEEIALAAGLHAVLNIVPGSKRQALGHYYGHPIAAHREAVALARRAYAVTVEPGADACVLNAYPKDGEMLQVGNAFNAYRGCDPAPVRIGGTVIVAAACPQGRGHHSLHGPGMRLYRDPVKRSYLDGRETVIYAPSVSTFDVRKSFWPGYAHARTWDDVVAALKQRHPDGGRMVVFPNAPLALPVTVAKPALERT